MHANDKLSSQRSTATSHERVTAIEMVVQNLYWLAISTGKLSTAISHTPKFKYKLYFRLQLLDSVILLLHFTNEEIVKNMKWICLCTAW